MKKIIFFLLVTVLPITTFSQKVSKKKIKKANIHYQNADKYFENEQFDEAEKEIDKAIELNTNKLSYHILKFDCIFSKKEFKKGFLYLDKIKKQFTTNPDVYILRGTIFEAFRDYKSAIKELKEGLKYVKKEKDKIYFYTNLGAYYSYLRRFKESESYLKKALELDPKNINVLNNLATTLADLHKKNEAIEIFKKILEIDSMYFPAYTNIGFILQEKEEHKEAIIYFSKSIQINSKEPLSYSNRSYSLLQIGKIEDALKDINISLELYSTNPYAYRNRALIYIQQGKINEACKDIQIGLELGFTKSYGGELINLQKEHCIKK